MKHNPPVWANRFLEWYCNPDILEEIQGDVNELYTKRLNHEGKSSANRKYVWDVLRFFRWSNIRRHKPRYSNNQATMIKNYLLLGFRNAIRHRVNSVINIVGLALALGCAITTFIFVDSQLTADTFHVNKDRIYQVTNRVEIEGRVEDWSDTPIPLGPMMVADQSAIESSTRVEYRGGTIINGDKVFNDFCWFVDKEFMQMFSFPLLGGNANTLNDPQHIVLSNKDAIKFFGQEDPVGKTLTIKFDAAHKEDFVVGAVIDLPQNTSLFPGILVSMDKFETLRFLDNYDWNYQTDATFIMLKPSTDVGSVARAMDKYKKLQNESSPQWQVADFQFHPLEGLNLESSSIVSAVSGGAHPAGLIAIGVLAGLLLLLACFNYMNISMATVATRLKEIGIRKVIGGKKKEIIQQFLVENFLLCAIAMILGCVVSYTLLLPGFNTLFPISISFSFSSGNAIFLFFGGLLLFVGFVSGAYPAFYVASFTPITIMRGREKFGQRSLFSRVLLTMQFVLAFVTIVGSFVFIDNSLYLQNRDWGYNHAGIIMVDAGNKENYLAMRDQFANDNSIVSLAGSAEHIGWLNRHKSVTHNEQKIDMVHYKVGFGYLETMNIRLKSGRLFDRSIQSDAVESVVVNQMMIDKMGWANPLDQTFMVDSVKRYVIGVVEDFHYDGFYSPLGPVMISIAPEDDFRFLTIKAKPGNVNDVLSRARTAWAGIAPDEPFEGRVQDDVFENFTRDNQSNMKLLGFISALTLVLASLGLFGLVAFNITRRMKEFSVRKVFGAGIGQIFRLMNRDYIWILGIAFFIGAPVGFLLMNVLIQHIYPDPQSAGPLPFIVAVSVMLMTVGITVGSQLRRIIRENPGQTLRND